MNLLYKQIKTFTAIIKTQNISSCC